jgi:HEAT repeat protein
LLEVIGKASGVEFRQYCQLATKLASRELASALSNLLKSEDDGVRRRAAWMLEHVEEV